jgi:hypothetical protein
MERLCRAGAPLLAAALAAGLVLAPAGAGQSRAQSALDPTDPRFFAQTGFRLDRDAFWSYFQARGGVARFGYPVSRDFTFLGCATQFFQRLVLQQCGGGDVQLLNLLDPDLFPYTQVNGSIFPAADSALKAVTPQVTDPAYPGAILAFVAANAPDVFNGQPVNFGSTFFGTVGPDAAGTDEPGVLGLLDLEVWGAPISRPAADPNNPNFIYQRFQRGIMHYDAGCGCTQSILLAGAYAAAKSADPNVVVVSAGLSPTGVTNVGSVDDLLYLQWLYAAGLKGGINYDALGRQRQHPGPVRRLRPELPAGLPAPELLLPTGRAVAPDAGRQRRRRPPGVADGVRLDQRPGPPGLLVVRRQRAAEGGQHRGRLPVRAPELAAVGRAHGAVDAGGPDLDIRPRGVLVGDHQPGRLAAARLHGRPGRSPGRAVAVGGGPGARTGPSPRARWPGTSRTRAMCGRPPC